MSTPTFEEALDLLSDGQVEEALPILERFAGSILRRRAEERDAFEKRTLEAEAETRRLEAGNLADKLRGSLADRFVDVDRMRPGDWSGVVSALPPNTTEETVAEVVADDSWASEVLSSLCLPVKARGQR